jgi:hypothetical protein
VIDHPHEERIGFFAIFALRNLLVILALEHYSLTTMLFPAAIALDCCLLICLVAYRRKVLQERWNPWLPKLLFQYLPLGLRDTIVVVVPFFLKYLEIRPLYSANH